ncbi:hypothetical protein GmRootV15_23660 [Variovorax sp. V15]
MDDVADGCPCKAGHGRRTALYSGEMTQPQPDVTVSPPPAADAQPELTETQAFMRAWVMFAVLFAVVLGLLWLLQSHFS